MQVSVARGPWYAAGLAAIVAAAVAGCSPSTSSGSAGSSAKASGSASAAPANALDAVKLAAKMSSQRELLHRDDGPAGHNQAGCG